MGDGQRESSSCSTIHTSPSGSARLPVQVTLCISTCDWPQPRPHAQRLGEDSAGCLSCGSGHIFHFKFHIYRSPSPPRRDNAQVWKAHWLHTTFAPALHIVSPRCCTKSPHPRRELLPGPQPRRASPLPSLLSQLKSHLSPPSALTLWVTRIGSPMSGSGSDGEPWEGADHIDLLR